MVRKKENKSVIWKFGWMEIIAWFSVVLFLVDYSIRTGDWWFELIAIFFVVTASSKICSVSTILVFIGIILSLVSQSKMWVRLPHSGKYL